MKLIILALCVALSLGARLSSPPNNPTPEQQKDELDEFEAYAMESLGAFDDDETTEEGGDDIPKSDIGDDDLPDVIYANVTEDGMIAVEDMIISPDMFDVYFPHVVGHPGNKEWTTIHKRAAVSSSSKLWPGGKIYYAYSTKLDGSQSKVRAAMSEWEKNTCVKFVYRPSGSSKYVLIRTSESAQYSCSSTLGYIGRKQNMNLGKNCFSHRTLLHEIGHTLGLIHEHQHPDRDRYITVIWNNIDKVNQWTFQFKTGVSSYGVPYDVMSVMHYWATAFAKKGCTAKPCYTMKHKTSTVYTSRMGRTPKLSTKSDIPIVKKMYKC